MKALATAFAMLAATPAAAQMAHICDDWQSQLWNIAEPWEQNTRSFANGAVRVAVIDTVEPAAAAYFLAVLVPLPEDPMGGRVCKLVGAGPLTGFAGLDFTALKASYDPARGLVLRLPVSVMNTDGGIDPRDVTIVVNQQYGDVSAGFE